MASNTPNEFPAKLVRIARISSVFTPSAPVDNAELFAMRDEQVITSMDALWQKGLHVALYGEPGVGKTSMARVLAEIVSKAGVKILNSDTVNCDASDDFSSLL